MCPNRLSTAGVRQSPTPKWWSLSQHMRPSCARVVGPGPALQPGLGDRPPARWRPGRLVNVAWDGGDHAFLLDTKVAGEHQRRGVATALVGVAVRHAKAAGCEWLHV